MSFIILHDRVLNTIHYMALKRRRRYRAGGVRSNNEATQRSLDVNTEGSTGNVEATASTLLLSDEIIQVNADLDFVKEKYNALRWL